MPLSSTRLFAVATPSWLEASLLNKDSSDAQERIFVSFESMAHFGDLIEASDATFSAEGSAIMKFGASRKIADLGDAPLLLTVTVEE